MSLRVYLIVFAILLGSTAFELAILGLPIARNLYVASLMGSAGVKAVLIAMFFQHLKYEPRPLSVVVLIPLLAAIILMGISVLSIANLPVRS